MKYHTLFCKKGKINLITLSDNDFAKIMLKVKII